FIAAALRHELVLVLCLRPDDERKPSSRTLAARRRDQESWLAHSGQSPNSSTVWSTSVKPASAATFSAHCSTARPSTSTLRPQVRQVRWWWCTLVSHCR